MPETSPEITPRCTRCGADALIPGAFLTAENYGTPKLLVGVHTNPKALVLKGPVRSEVRFRVCGDCGLVEAEAADPHKLWDAYVERLAREIDD